MATKRVPKKHAGGLPVLFELLRLLNYVPTKVLSPLIAALIEKSAAPFSSDSNHSELIVAYILKQSSAREIGCLRSRLQETL